jgi:hypothetical protein
VVKSEEQNYNQHSLLLLRTSEAEIINDELQSINKTISAIQTANSLSESQAKSITSELSTKLRDLHDARHLTYRDLQLVYGIFEQTFQAIMELPGANPDTIITEKSVLGCLADAETVLFELFKGRKRTILRGKRGEISPLSIKSTLADSLLEEEEAGAMTEKQIRSRVKALFTPQGTKRPLLL